ncbi:hypothetical protein BH11BAC3_BH11BAC3_19530 [soil metagenome]
MESILNQDFRDFEILVIDNVSKDRTLEQVRSFEDSESRVRIFSEKDSGIYDAMNKGMQLSRGKWLFFLGSDDTFFDTNVLANLFSYLQNGDYDVVYGNVYSIAYKKLYDGAFSKDKIISQNICHQSIFFNKKVFDIIGQYNLKYHCHSDWDSNLKWFFSPRLKSAFIPLTIAVYGDGGYSALGDEAFARDKEVNVLRSARRFMTRKERLSILIQEFKKSYKEHNYRRIISVFFMARYLIRNKAAAL